VLDRIEEDARMRSFQPFWSARAYLCAEAGRREDALDAYRLACGLTADTAVRRYLQGRMKMLIDG
jgi:RNA polymerase sigma-70 factor, ECF subfamily